MGLNPQKQTICEKIEKNTCDGCEKRIRGERMILVFEKIEILCSKCYKKWLDNKRKKPDLKKK